MEPRKYQFNNSTVTVIFGDIMNSKAEVIVSSDDTGISMGGGVSACIRNKGGDSILIDARKKLPAKIGDVVVSTAGDLKHQKYIFHCMTIGVSDTTLSSQEEINSYILQHTVDKCFRLLQALEINTIAFPCIGAGIAGIPMKQVAEIMVNAIARKLCLTQKRYNVELYLLDRFGSMREMDYIDIFENFAIKSAVAKMESIQQKEDLQEEPEAAKCSLDEEMAILKREEMNHSVFISYSRQDKETVYKICDILKDHKIPYWIDKTGILSGENYKEVIVDAIQVAKIVLFASSASSNASNNVVKEIGYAAGQNKTIIPIKLDDAPYAKSIALDIWDTHQIEFKNLEQVKNELITGLAYHLEIR